MISMMTPFVLPGTYGAMGALAITITDRFRSQNDVADESKSSFFSDLARNLAIGVVTPIATLALLKTAVHLGVVPAVASAVAAFLGLSLVLQVAITVIVVSAIVLAIAIPVLLSRRAKAEENVDVSAKVTVENNEVKGTANVKVKEDEVIVVLKENQDDSELTSEFSEEDAQNLVDQSINDKTPNDNVQKDLSASTIVRVQENLDKELDEVIESLHK